MVRPTSVTDGVRSLGSSLGWVSPIETRSGRTLSAYLSCIHLYPPSLHSRRRNPVLPTTVTLEFSDHLSIPSTIALVGSLYPLRTIDRSPLLGPCCVRSRRFDHLSQTSLSPCFFFFLFGFYLVSTMDYPVRDRWERSKRDFSVFHLGFWFWIGDPGLKLCLVAEVCPLEAGQDVQ